MYTYVHQYVHCKDIHIRMQIHHSCLYWYVCVPVGAAVAVSVVVSISEVLIGSEITSGNSSIKHHTNSQHYIKYKHTSCISTYVHTFMCTVTCRVLQIQLCMYVCNTVLHICMYESDYKV